MRRDDAPTVPGIVLLALVVVLVALAGCTSGGDATTTVPGTQDDVPTTDEVTPTPSSTVPTTTTTSSTTTTTSQPTTTTTSPPDDGSENPVSGDHVTALNAAGSFTTRMRVEVRTVQRGRNVTRTLDRVIYVNLDTDRALLNQTLRSAGRSAVASQFTAGEETYQRLSTGATQPRYDYATAPYEGSVQPVNVSFARGETFITAQNISWTAAGETTLDGVAVTKYTATGLDAFDIDPEEFTAGQLARVDSLTATAYVDGDGIVRRMNWSLRAVDTDGNEYVQTQSLSFTDVGSTTVEDPAWLSAARNATGAGS